MKEGKRDGKQRNTYRQRIWKTKEEDMDGGRSRGKKELTEIEIESVNWREIENQNEREEGAGQINKTNGRGRETKGEGRLRNKEIKTVERRRKKMTKKDD